MAAPDTDIEKWVWLPHQSLVWTPAKIVETAAGLTTYETFGKERITYQDDKIEPGKLERLSPSSLSPTENLVQLEDFHEGSIIHQLRERYRTDKIYTHIGTILVSINPYKLLNIYTSVLINQYRADHTNLEPHVFTIAAECFKRLMDEGDNQSVIISGESGAGKTEATKTVLQFISEVAGSESGVEQEILQSNPVLEAFGNAKTMRNNNSSRFGKYMEICFDISGRVCAARIEQYLLEKSRVVFQSKDERNYHIFYQLIAGLNEQQKAAIFLKDAKSYHYLNQSGCYEVEDQNSTTHFRFTNTALRALGFTPEEVNEIWLILSLILNLGNLEFISNKKDGSEIANKPQLGTCANMLQIKPENLGNALCFRAVTIRGELSMIPLTPPAAVENRDALAKATYGYLFVWLIHKINKKLHKSESKKSIGILDIFGFEIFENNQFEQFCINYANEKLQQHFNNYIFKLEQEEYKKEGVDVSRVEFVDNIECLRLVEKKPLGIIGFLNEEVALPKGSDKSLIEKMHKAFSEEQQNPYYGLIKQTPHLFVIKHYAGQVMYNINGFLVKNKDKLQEGAALLMIRSSRAIIRDVYADSPEAEDFNNQEMERVTKIAEKEKASGGPSTIKGKDAAILAAASQKLAEGGTLRGVGKKAMYTLASQFQSQLEALMNTLNATSPHYIRCIKPNPEKKPDLFQTVMILRQMRYAGLFEAIRIRRSGFAFRKDYPSFVSRFRLALNGPQLKTMQAMSDARKKAEHMIKSFGAVLNHNDIAFGHTKIFMKYGQRLILDRIRDKALEVCAIKVQARARGLIARRRAKFLRSMIKKIQSILEERDINKITEVLSECELKSVVLPIMKKLTPLKNFLEEEQRVIRLLENACKTNELEDLTSALSVCETIDSKFTGVDTRKTGKFLEMFKKAMDQKAKILAMFAARQALADAILAESITELLAAITTATNVGLTEAEMTEAKDLLKLLQAEKKIMDELIAEVEKATSGEGDVDVLEASIEKTVNITLDAERRKVIANAKAVMKGKYDDFLSMAMEHSDELEIKDELIPKFKRLQYTDLLAKAELFMVEQERKREEERIRIQREREEAERRRQEEERLRLEEEARVKREAERKAEEEKIAAAAASAAERKRLEDELRRKREAEDRAIAAQQAKEQAERDAAEAERVAKEKQEADALLSKLAANAERAEAQVRAEEAKKVKLEQEKLEKEEASKKFAATITPGALRAGGDVKEDEDGQPLPPLPNSPGAPPPPPDFDGAAPPAPSDGVPPPPPDTTPEELMDQSLRRAMKSRDLTQLITLLRICKKEGFRTRTVRIALNLTKKLKQEQDTLEKLRLAVQELSINKMKALLREVSALAIPPSPLLEKARHLCYGMPKAEFLALQIKTALQMKDIDKLKGLLSEAEEDKVESEDIEAARDFLAVELGGNDWNTLMRKQRQQSVTGASKDDHKEQYRAFIQIKGQMPLRKCNHLRKENNYLKGIFNPFKKKKLKESMFTFQKDDIPRSLMKLSTAYCGGSLKESRRIKHIAPIIFKNIRHYMGDLFHAYPVTLAFDIISTGSHEPFLRDEIFVQLIKQTSQNPAPESLLFGFKLFYLCISTFAPSKELAPYILSHLALFAHPSLDTHELTVNNVADLATLCYMAYEITSQADPNKQKDAPTMSDIEKLTDGTMSSVKSLRSGGKGLPNFGGASTKNPAVQSVISEAPNFGITPGGQYLVDFNQDSAAGAPFSVQFGGDAMRRGTTSVAIRPVHREEVDLPPPPPKREEDEASNQGFLSIGSPTRRHAAPQDDATPEMPAPVEEAPAENVELPPAPPGTIDLPPIPPSAAAALESKSPRTAPPGFKPPLPLGTPPSLLMGAKPPTSPRVVPAPPPGAPPSDVS